jgi:anti-sigma-K factor RskA
MEHREIVDLLPLAALDRLEPAESRELEEHLALGCESCLGELRAYREAAVALALGESQEDDDGRIWRKLRQRLEPSPQDTAPGMFDSASAISPAGQESARHGGNPGLWRAIAGMSLAAMIATAMVAIEFTRSLSGEVTYHGKVADELARRNDLLRRQLALSHRKLQLAEDSESETRAHLTRIVLSADARGVRLSPPPVPTLAKLSDARGLVTISAKADGAALQVSGLPQLAPGKVYELWWIGAKGGSNRAGLFRTGAQGDAAITTNLPPPGDVLMASAVTVEPDGGVPKPTGPTVLKGQVNPTKLSRSQASRTID